MPLQPLRFKNSEEVNNLFNRLQALNLITLDKNEIKIVSPELLEKQFLTASDGNIYLLDDVQNYLKEATQEEIDASTVSFFIKTNKPLVSLNLELNSIETNLNKESVTLAAVKANPLLLEKVATVQTGKFLSFLNPKLYSDKRLPLLIRNNEIQKTKSEYNNWKLVYLVIQTNEQIEKIISIMSSHPQITQVPLDFKSSDFLDPVRKDIYIVTLMQQIKLKYHLLGELKKNTNPLERNQLNQWIKEIDEQNSHIKKLLKIIISRLKDHELQSESAQLKYTKIVQEDPDGIKIKHQIADKKDEAKEHQESIEQLESIFSVLKPVAVVSTVALLYLLFLAAVLILPSLILILAAPLPLLCFSLIIFESVSVMLLVRPVVHGIFNLGDIIENKFDSVIEEKNMKQNELHNEILELELDTVFRTMFSKNSPEFIANGVNHDDLIKEIEADLVQVSEFEEKVRASMPPAVEPKLSAPVGKQSMFPTLTRSRSMEELAAVEEVEQPRLTRSASFAS